MKETIEITMKDCYKLSEPTDSDKIEKLDTLNELLDDPEVKAALLERLDA